MHASAKPIAEIFLFNYSLIENSVADLSESESANQSKPGINSITWLIGHCLAGRVLACSIMGLQIESESAKLFNGNILDSDVSSLPTPSDLLAEIRTVTKALLPKLAGMQADELKTAPKEFFPTAENTTLAALAFLAQHESYHIGQISLLRRQLGKDGLVDLLLR